MKRERAECEREIHHEEGKIQLMLFLEEHKNQDLKRTLDKLAHESSMLDGQLQ